MSEIIGNLSSIKLFFLSGMQELGVYKPLYFFLVFVIYVLIIVFNLTLIFTVTVDKSLHEPMYIFMSSLCANGLYGTVGFYPKFLLDLQSDTHTITYSWCTIQAYVIYSSGVCEMAILSVMSYDRYVAICRPIHYHSILTPHAVLKLVLFAWAYPLILSLIGILLTDTDPVCKSQIPKLFCDSPSLQKMRCYQTVANQAWSTTVVTIYIIQVLFIVVSYGRIIQVCIASREGRRKFSNTCVPHILVMVIHIMTLLLDVFYSWTRGPPKVTYGLQKALSVQFLILPPLLNPVIYGLRLTLIRKAIYKRGRKIRCCHRSD